jgi:hypothetical protein
MTSAAIPFRCSASGHQVPRRSALMRLSGGATAWQRSRPTHGRRTTVSSSAWHNGLEPWLSGVPASSFSKFPNAAGGAAISGQTGAPRARTQAAVSAGMSESQQKVTVRLARIDADSFERAVEGPNPPGVARLAGRSELRPPSGPAGPDGGFERARGLLSALLVCYRSAPPAVRARIRDMVARAFATVDDGVDRMPAKATPL